MHTITNRVLKSRPDLTEQVLRAYRPVAAKVTWRAIVEEISLENASPELVAILIDGIDASEPDLREETVWAMIVRLSKGKNVPPPLLEAVAARAQRRARWARPHGSSSVGRSWCGNYGRRPEPIAPHIWMDRLPRVSNGRDSSRVD